MKLSTHPGVRVAIIASMFQSITLLAQQLAPTPPGYDFTASPQTPDSGEPAAEAERVVVTGSYIPIPTAESEDALPVVNYTREQLLNFGSNTPAEALRHLPSFIGTTPNENDSNGGNGSAQVNLRAFGPQNTLTLINGRRAFSFKDINALPLGVIESVEILKDGASATYGADAVAGVVNFKIRHALNSGEADLLYGNTNLGSANDAGVKTAYAVDGLTGKRYNITVGASYYEREAIYAADTFLSSLANRRRFGGTNDGSPFFPGVIAANHSVPNDGSIPGAPVGTFTSALNTYILTNLATTPTSFGDYRRSRPNDGFNFREVSPSIPAQERYGFFLDGEYQLLPDNYLTIFGTAIYSHTNQDNGLAPATFRIRDPDFLAGSPYNPVETIPQIDPATGMQAIDPRSNDPVFRQRIFGVFYRPNEIGNRRQTFDSDFYHYIAGLKGEFAKNYFWEFGCVYDEHTQIEIDAGDDRFSVIADAIADGRFNPFVGLNAPKQGTLNGFTYDNSAVLEAAQYTASSKIQTRDQSWDGKLGGRVFTALPQGGFNFVVGFDLRHEELSQVPDPILVAGDVLGFQPLVPLDTSQDVSAAFLELNIPIVSSPMEIPGVYNADFTFAWRYEHFDITGTDPVDVTRRAERTFATDVPKFAFRYAPYKDLTLRASYSRSFRAPDARSLFTPILTQAGPVDDPIAPNGNTAFPDITTGGDVSLGPERTDSYSAGFVFTPRQVPNLTMTADYYQLNSKDILVSGTIDFVLSQNAANGSFADRIVRDSAGNLLSIIDTPFNAARKSAEGIDITAVYEIPTQNWGKITISLAYNHLFRFNAEIVKGVGFTNFLGQFQNGSALVPGSLPRNKGYLQVDWAYKSFDFINTLNYIGDYQDFGGGVFNSEPILNESQQSPDPANLHYTGNRDVREYVTFDTQISYTYHPPKTSAASDTALAYRPHWWQQFLDNTTLRVGMNNIFDTPPPFNAGAFGDNYDTSLYSLRGRYYYIGLNKKF